jgi:hypothetical protein
MAKGAIVSANATGSVDLLYNPYQQAFLEAKRARLSDGRRAFNRLGVFAGRRGGKTRIGAVGVAEELTIPNSLGWACAPSYPELYDYVVPAVFATIPNAWIKDWSLQHLTLTCHNHARMSFRSLDDPERARGPGLDWAWLDEARKIAEKAWNTLLPALIDKRGTAWVTTSPNGFDWTYKRFYLPAYEMDPGFWACKYKTLDNPAIDASEVIAAKKQLDPLFYQQEFEADFVSFAGAVFGNLIDASVIPRGEIRRVLPTWPDIPTHLRCIVGLDPGADHPFAGVLLLETEAGLVCIGEYVARHKPVADHVFELHKLIGNLHPEQWACDKTQLQTIIELQQHGIMAAPAPYDVVGGITRVGSWLRARRLWLPEDTCPKLIEQLRGYRWDENVGSDGQMRRERVVKIQDDLCDALRYAIMLWPFQPQEIDGDVPSSSLRDLSAMPESVRWSVERMRRCDGDVSEQESFGVDFLAEVPDGDNPLGDFWR